MPSSPIARIPLNTFAIPLGLTGLAEIWSDAGTALRLPVPLTESFWVIAAGALIWTIVAHLVRGSRSDATFASQLTHPVQGPIAAILPIVGMLIGINVYGLWPVAGTVVIVISIVLAAAFASWIVTFWLRGGLTLDSVHGAYFLPSVAASFVAGGAASVIGAHTLATGAFAVGAFFWVVMFALIATRLAFRAPLPTPLVPTMAILMAPPAVAGLSWFIYNGGRIDAVVEALLGMAILLLLVEVQFLRLYVGLTFTLGFWSFAFPTAFMGAFLIEWMSKSPFVGWSIVASVILGIVTLLVAAIAVLSIRLAYRAREANAVSAPRARQAGESA